MQKESSFQLLLNLIPGGEEKKIPDLPEWNRGAFSELMQWIENPPVQRAVLLSGPRQVGKTTLLLQAIQHLLKSGVHPGNILYATFDHLVCKLAGLDAVLEAWRELEPKKMGRSIYFSMKLNSSKISVRGSNIGLISIKC